MKIESIIIVTNIIKYHLNILNFIKLLFKLTYYFFSELMPNSRFMLIDLL